MLPLMHNKRGLIMGVANQNSIAWGIARTLHAHGAEIAFDEHAVEQRHRDAAAVQVRNELRFGGDEDEIVGRIDDAAQQPDQRPILRNCSDRHRRGSAGVHGRIEFRLRQHVDGDRAP